MLTRSQVFEARARGDSSQDGGSVQIQLGKYSLRDLELRCDAKDKQVVCRVSNFKLIDFSRNKFIVSS